MDGGREWFPTANFPFPEKFLFSGGAVFHTTLCGSEVWMRSVDEKCGSEDDKLIRINNLVSFFIRPIA